MVHQSMPCKKLQGVFLLIYILKAEIVNDGRKGAERTNGKVQEAFPAEQWFQDAHRFP